ncbi:RING finger protein 207-like isoform X2 [Argopecten irradians]
MSGEIFQRDPGPDNLDDVDVIGRNPLMCFLCNEKYEDPCILGCYHSFCSTCLRGRAKDGKMHCPLCKDSTTLKEGESLPPKDKLLQFLVMSSSEEREQCANCDKDEGQMYFCNTCSQPLCEGCRDETHRAKMFTRHDIVLLSKRTKEIHRECALHQEPFILFSTEKKTMLCINCFRDMKIESRSYCVDMETAYHQSCKKLDQRMQAIRDLQNSVQDSIMLLRALLEEITQNSELEKSAIKDLYNSMVKEITEKQETLLMEVDRQYQDKQKLFTEELASLTTLLPTLHTHLVTCAAFSSSANKFEFLDLAYILMERLKSIIHLQYPLHPSQGSQIYTDFKSQIAKCLEPLLFPKRVSSALSSSPAGSLTLSTAATTAPRSDLFRLEKSTFDLQTKVKSGNLSQNERRQVALNKLKLAEGKGAFAEHCQDFDTSHKSLSQMVERLKSHLQELQRDLTLRRCLTKQTVMEELQGKVEQVEQKLEGHKTRMEQKQPLLEKHWEECVQRITCEQEVYQAQLQDVMRLHQETSHLRTILNQLSRFVTSITALTERLAPKLATSSKESDHDNQIAAIFEQINTMEPDSQHRVEAIRTAEEERESQSANRTNPMDEELIKTKGLLRAPSLRREGAQRRRESKDGKEGSVEKELSQSPGKALTLDAYLTEMETAGKVSKGEVSKVDVNKNKITEIASPKKKEDINDILPKSPLIEDVDLSTLLDEIDKQEKGENSTEQSEESVGQRALSEVVKCAEGTVSETRQTKPISEVASISQTNNTTVTKSSSLSNKCMDGEPGVNITDTKLSLKTSITTKEVSCDISPISSSPGGQTPESQTVSSNSPTSGSVSPRSNTPSSKIVSPGDISEVDGQEDDMTGGETLRARIERLKVSIDNGTTVPQRPRSPQDSVAQGSRSPQDTVTQGSRSPKNKCPLSNGIPQKLDNEKVLSQKLNDSAVPSVENGEVSPKGDNCSKSEDVKASDQPNDAELKSPTQSRAGNQASGRRRRRIKPD